MDNTERLRYVPQAMTEDEVAKVHDLLWQALIFLPVHRHNTLRDSDCKACTGRAKVAEAYRALPDGRFIA